MHFLRKFPWLVFGERGTGLWERVPARVRAARPGMRATQIFRYTWARNHSGARGNEMKYDAIAIGSGQAGNPLSFALADLGWKVALIERAELGGSCINTGCTPTKTMVASAQVAHYARDAARWECGRATSAWTCLR